MDVIPRTLALGLVAAVLFPRAAAGQERRSSEPIPLEDEAPPTPPAPVEDGRRPWLVEWPGWRGIVIERYNRTDGLVPGFGVDLEPTSPERAPEIALRVSTSTTRLGERFFWHAGIRQRIPFPGTWVAHAGVEIFQSPTTFDDWKLSPRENDFATFLVGSDLLDWWRERGWRAALEIESERGDLVTRVAFLSADQFSQHNRDPFVLFGGDDFRENPPVEEGLLQSVTVSQRLDTRDVQSPLLPAPGWLLALEVERAGGFLGGDVEFTRALGDLRRYVRFGRDAWWDTRFVWIESDAPEGDPVPQRKAMLGGPGSLRGFRAASFVGTDALQLNSEVRLPLPVTDEIALFFLSWHWVGFVDVGSVDETWEWHADVGTGVSGINIFSYVGVFIAQQITDLGGPDDGPRLVVRLRRDF